MILPHLLIYCIFKILQHFAVIFFNKVNYYRAIPMQRHGNNDKAEIIASSEFIDSAKKYLEAKGINDYTAETLKPEDGLPQLPVKLTLPEPAVEGVKEHVRKNNGHILLTEAEKETNTELNQQYAKATQIASLRPTGPTGF